MGTIPSATFRAQLCYAGSMSRLWWGLVLVLGCSHSARHDRADHTEPPGGPPNVPTRSPGRFDHGVVRTFLRCDERGDPVVSIFMEQTGKTWFQLDLHHGPKDPV